MAEYIEREALLDSICHDTCRIAFCGATNCAFMAKVCSAPAADVAPVVHGRWVDAGRGIKACSNCNHGIKEHMAYANHYCPNCGAKMDGGADHMGLREKLIHYTNDLGDVDLKQEAIATIEHIAQYMDEDELLHHSRHLALAYLALTEDASGLVVRCKNCRSYNKPKTGWCEVHLDREHPDDFCGYGKRREKAEP